MLQNKLLQIGLTENESMVYTELLHIGPQAVSVIAKRLRLNRTTTYSVLRSLEKKGLVSSCKMNCTQCFSANDPNALIAFVDRQQRIFEYHREEILTLIPHFRQTIAEYDFKKPMVSYFEGIEGVKHVMFDALSARTEFYAYLGLHKWFESGLKDFLIKYKNLRINSKKVHLKAITPDTNEVRAFFNDNYDFSDGLTEIVYIRDQDLWGMFENELNIYDDKVAIMHFEPGAEYGVLIESQEIAAMQRKIFEMVWKGVQEL